MIPQRFSPGFAAAFATLVLARANGARAQLPVWSAWSGSRIALLCVAILLLASLFAGSASASAFNPAPPLATARSGHTSTLLSSGKVLVVGGSGAGGAALGSTELYDPLTQSWSAGPALPGARTGHTASLLRSGKVLVVGGYDGAGFVTTAQLYDPLSNSWNAAAAPASTRTGHTATVLASGQVLVVGGNNESVLTTAELYDPASNSWAAGRPLTAARTNHSATLMPSGRVLIVGGFRIAALNSAVLYDPPTDTWITALTLATPRSAHTATLLPNGKVLVSGGLNGGNAIASAELFDATTGWSTVASMGATRQGHAAALLSTGEVLVAGGAVGSAGGSARQGGAELYDPVANRWNYADPLLAARSQATLTALPNGRLLLVAGSDVSGALSSAELYERSTPYLGVWVPGGALQAGRMNHTTTLLPSGKALVVGGGLISDGNSALASVELYDQAANTFSAAVPLAVPRRYHSATLLNSGKVLVVGGYNGTNILNTAVVYDPAANSWASTGNMSRSRGLHTATLLASGKVLIVGGTEDGGGMPTLAEVYDPATNNWTNAGNITTARFHHIAGLLPSGKVLITGGDNGPADFSSTEIYDPGTNTWSPGASMSIRRQEAAGVVLPSGKVLVAGGASNGILTNSVEQYDPATNSWSGLSSTDGYRRWHTAALLPSGRVLIAGGVDAYFNYTVYDWAEVYDPVSNAWTTAGTDGAHRFGHTLTPMASGRVLVVGGTDGSTSHASSALYQPRTTSWAYTSVASALSGRGAHTASLLSTGRLLLAGGANDVGTVATTERYDPAGNAWSAGGTLTTARKWHTATTLPDGRVLAVGGQGSAGALGSVERYDPSTNAWTGGTAALTTARHSHTATLLPNGQVLVVGGFNSAALGSAERYDPATNAWTSAGTLTTARYAHAATLLSNGKVLVTGGRDANGTLDPAELYDPASNSWSSAGAFTIDRELHTATLLHSGKVITIGGRSGSNARGTLEVYDPSAQSWTRLNIGLITPTFSHAATLLPSGQVLITGGDRGDGGGQRRVAIYDPVTNDLLQSSLLVLPRYGHTATLLPSGKVLVAGGFNTNGAIAGAELFDPDLAPVATRRADIVATSSFATATTALVANTPGTSYSGGAVQTTGFLSPFEGSGGNGAANSATAAPLIQLQRLDNGQSRYVDTSAAVATTDTVFTGRAAALSGFPPGPVLVRAWVNGVPGAASYSTIAATAGQPTAVSATAGTLQATVNFTAPTNYSGGAPITGYLATATGGATASCTAPCSSIVFNPLPGGSYTFSVSAVNAAGAGTPSATSNSILVKAAPSLSVSSGTNPSSVGDSVTFTATLAQAYQPSGNVQFCANSAITTSGCSGGTVLCTVAANTSPITCTTAALPVGSHFIAAWFAGDTNNFSADSPQLTQAVKKRVPSLSWAPPAAIIYGTTLGAAQLNAAATYNGNPVAGTFSYTPPAGTVLGAGAGQQLSATFAPTDTATYATTGEVVTTTLDVQFAATTTIMGSVASARVGVALAVPYTVANAGSGPAIPADSVVVVTASPGGATCSASVAAGQCALTFAAAGSYTLSAEYQGSANFLPSSSAPASVSVSTNTTTTVLGATPNPSTLGQFVTASVSVTDTTGGPVPTGSVTVSASSGETCTATLSGGAGQCAMNMMQLGAHTLTASYGGDAANAASSDTETQQVNGASVAVSVDDHHAYARYGSVPDYVVTLSNSGNVSANVTLSASSPGTGLNLAGTQWFCTSNGGGSGCADGSGVFSASVSLPANSTMSWTLLVPVVAATTDTSVELRIAVSGNGGPVSASDVNTLVLFRNGLQVPSDSQ